jgi:SPP1 family predicted phage head-tail adaptor
MRPIGEYFHRIEFEKDESPDQDDYGQPQENWQVYARRWASITVVDGSETVEGGKPTAKRTIHIHCPIVKDVNPAHRIKWKGRVFEIRSAENLMEMNQELRIRCVEKVEPDATAEM